MKWPQSIKPDIKSDKEMANERKTKNLLKKF